MELQPGVSPALISKTVTNVLRLEMANDEMLPLLHSLIDGLTDEIVQSGKGSSLILCSLLETRAGEGKIVRHTIYTRNNMCQKCEGNCGLWALNKII